MRQSSNHAYHRPRPRQTRHQRMAFSPPHTGENIHPVWRNDAGRPGDPARGDAGQGPDTFSSARTTSTIAINYSHNINQVFASDGVEAHRDVAEVVIGQSAAAQVQRSAKSTPTQGARAKLHSGQPILTTTNIGVVWMPRPGRGDGYWYGCRTMRCISGNALFGSAACHTNSGAWCSETGRTYVPILGKRTLAISTMPAQPSTYSTLTAALQRPSVKQGLMLGPV